MLVFSQNSFLYPIKKGWVKNDGKEIVLSYADSTFYSSEGFSRFISKGKYGFINSKGFEIVKPQYESLTAFKEGIAFAKKDFSWRAIDTNGKELFTVTCNYVYPFSDGMARFQLGNKFGYINTSGKVVLMPTYSGAFDFNSGLARVYTDKWVIIDKNGAVKSTVPFHYCWDFSSGLAAISKKEGTKEFWGYMDVNGKQAIPFFEGYAFPFINEVALVRIGPYKTGTIALINKEGKQIVQLNYADAFLCENGLVNVCEKINGVEKWGYVDHSGKVVVAIKYDDKAFFINGLASVVLEGKRAYINPDGEVVWKEI